MHSVYALCGIRPGDTWAKVNAVSLASAEDVLRSYEALRKAPDLTISLLRKDQPFDVTVTFR
jgi:S1-C subfamily serine protease